MRRESAEKEARMRAFEWKAKRAAGRKSEREAAEEKKERRLIFLSRWWSYSKRGRERKSLQLVHKEPEGEGQIGRHKRGSY